MKRVICDQCHAEVEPNAYGLAPKGWLRVSVRDELADKDYCSKTCAVTALKAPEPVSDVERTIEDAERAGLNPAVLV